MKLLFFDTYIDTIKNSVGSEIFQTLWAEKDNKKVNIIEAGKKACGLHISGILNWFELIESNHATVEGTLKDMKKSGWVKIEKPKPGCIIHWEQWDQGGDLSEHIGFYIGDEKAISNGWKEKVPIEHHWTYNDTREIENLYWHPKLDNEYFNG